MALGLYGWHHWLRGGRARGDLPVSVMSVRRRCAWVALTIAATLGWGHVMARYTDAALPYGDAFTTVASLVAQWLLARKRLESWAFWIVVDVVAIAIYWSRDLRLTSGLYAGFLILAILGWWSWSGSRSGRRAPLS